MASEDVEQTHTPKLPESVTRWLDEKAAELDCSRQQLLSELLTAHRTLDEDDAIDGELNAVREEFTSKLTDVRERVVQVKRETDGKASTDHAHPDLRAELIEVQRAAEEVDALRERVEENRERVDSGFENYESVLEYLTETTDELENRLDVLARALVSVRDQTRTLATQNATRAATAELARTANRNGIESAKCCECGTGVTISLLTEPSCPHCSATFEGVESKRSFLGSDRLVVGRPPAIEGETIDSDVDASVDEVEEMSEEADR
ncbi:hypothetical protein ACFFQF_12465 [Haladaptatus pallidirubidus]|uniref:CopG family transcriptional regulator n=1 Tax=Haladaptatus pallidirubidus TaxID=1008152 RepID=A0AAV3UE10_9EURY|nr:hypothetical protein [Haladaptatus pallidirubidus]